MGMDVYGKNADRKSGRYFRNSVWWWHPLWEYCAMISEVAAAVEHGHSNDGDGLDAEASRLLSRELRAAIKSGATKAYAKKRKEEIDAMPDIECEICDGTGKRTEAPNVGAGNIPCNGCAGRGRRRPSGESYHFSVENVASFAEFLAHCGGFEIL